MERRLPVGLLIGALGALMLVVSLFLDWYEGVTAFTVFELLDLVLLALALLTVGALFGGLGVVRAASAPGIALVLSGLTVLVVLSQVVNDPPAVSGGRLGHETGIWIAVAGSLLMLLGAVLSWGRISLAVDLRPKTQQDTRPTPQPREEEGEEGDRPGPRWARPTGSEEDPTIRS